MNYEIDGIIYHVVIDKKPNKNIYIRIKENNIIYVTAPKRTTEKEIQKIIENNIQTIKKMLKKSIHKQEKNKNFYYLGNIYDIIIVNNIDKLDIVNDKIYAKDEKMLNKYIKKEMEKLFKERYDFYYNNFEEKIEKPVLKIRNMKTRWGVYNRKSKTITLNSNLIKYPIECLDYVIVHELSHIIHFNHSKNFWALVEYYYPSYKKSRKLLKD